MGLARESGLCARVGSTVAITIDFSKALNLVPHDQPFTELAVWGVDWRVDIWVRELVVGRTERVSVGGQLSEEVKITSVVWQTSVLSTL
jgi:hypothetical protein